MEVVVDVIEQLRRERRRLEIEIVSVVWNEAQRVEIEKKLCRVIYDLRRAEEQEAQYEKLKKSLPEKGKTKFVKPF